MAAFKSPGNSPKPTAKKRSCRLLVALIVVLAAVCILFLNWLVSAQKQRSAAQLISNSLGSIRYDHPFANADLASKEKKEEMEPPWPAWLYECFGRDSFHNVVGVHCGDWDDLSVLEAFPKLEDVSCDLLLKDQDIEPLSRLRRLRKVELANTGIGDVGAATLCTLDKLEFLDLSGTAITSKAAAELKLLPKLAVLRLNYTRIDDAALENLSELSPLKELSLDGTMVRGDGLQFLANLDCLESLSLNETPLTDDGLALVENLRNLKSISIDSTRVTDAGVKRLRASRPNLEIHPKSNDLDGAAAKTSSGP